jgi:dTDP-4-amino-4,6-dideoxygalactose transaminase
MSLPMFPELTTSQIERVAAVLSSSLASNVGETLILATSA